MSISRFTDIRAWRLAKELAEGIYRVTEQGTAARDYAFRDQIRRAAISGMSNIAEGFGRNSDQDFARFLDISRGSLGEVQSLIHLGVGVGHLTLDQAEPLLTQADDAIGTIAGFAKYLRQGQCHEDASEGYVP